MAVIQKSFRYRKKGAEMLEDMLKYFEAQIVESISFEDGVFEAEYASGDVMAIAFLDDDAICFSFDV